MSMTAHVVVEARTRFHLTPTESAIYDLLRENEGQVLSPVEIARHIFGYTSTLGAERQLFRTHVFNLRAKLSWAEAAKVRTMRDVGYYFSAEELPRPVVPYGFDVAACMAAQERMQSQRRAR